MTYAEEDIYTTYEVGLRNLLNRLGKSHTLYMDALTYEKRLIENITWCRQHGDTQPRQSERTQLLDQLNSIANDALTISFEALCQASTIVADQSRWTYSMAENQLREHISDSRLRASLTAIRQTVDFIWDPDSPRMIQDSIERGMEYCKRLVDLVTQILEANDGRNLSGHEYYLLLAGIYLHGIGLQCNIIELPEIRNRAEQMGAQFNPHNQNTGFNRLGKSPVTSSLGRLRDTSHRSTPLSSFQHPLGNGSSPYSIEQQKLLRKNYHYVSAAWIDYANMSGETDLGPAAMTIPRDMIDDLKDMCLYHIRLPITDCPITFTFESLERKQFIATLIRLAAELDVTLNRVPVETIETFDLDPRSAVYWWMHHRTGISFVARNILRLTTRLHPEDKANYGEYLHDAFIVEFQNKNTPVFNILRANGIPIAVDISSGIIDDSHAERIPQEIIHALQTIQQGRGPIFDLANEVRTWLVATRYEVSDPKKRNERTVEMRASLEQGTVRHMVRIFCIRGQITPEDVDSLNNMLDRSVPHGWIISDRRVSDLARRRSASNPDVKVFQLSDFLQQKIWGLYIDSVQAMMEKDRIEELAVEISYTAGNREIQRCSPNSPSADSSDEHEEPATLTHFIDTWLGDRTRKHLTIQGDTGAGKTWFCRLYTYRQLKCYLKNPTSERLPLLITLRNFTKAVNARQLINDALLEQYNLPFVGSGYDIFEEMNRRGKMVLILDGFDELPHQQDPQSVIDFFWDMTETMSEHSKIILTCRSGFFSWERATQTKEAMRSISSTCSVASLNAAMFENIHIKPLTHAQVTQTITRQIGKEDGPVMADHILSKKHLASVACCPGHIQLLLAALQETSSNNLHHLSHIYLHASNKLLIRRMGTQRIFRSTQDKLYFLCELAWDMIYHHELRMKHRKILQHFRDFIHNSLKTQYERDTWDYDLLHQHMLQRSADGYYEFTNRNIAEYFVALKFAAELGCLDPAFLAFYLEPDGKSVETILPQKSIPQLLKTFGAFSLLDGHIRLVRELLMGMFAPNAAQQLWQLIESTRHNTPEQVRNICSNSVTLLALMGESFHQADLSYVTMYQTNLCNADVSDANFSESILIRVNFTGSNLSGANLQKTNLRGTIFAGCNLNHADLRETDIVYSSVITATEDIQCEGMQIAGARGLDQVITWIDATGYRTKMTLRDYFIQRGAVE